MVGLSRLPLRIALELPASRASPTHTKPHPGRAHANPVPPDSFTYADTSVCLSDYLEGVYFVALITGDMGEEFNCDIPLMAVSRWCVAEALSRDCQFQSRLTLPIRTVDSLSFLHVPAASVNVYYIVYIIQLM